MGAFFLYHHAENVNLKASRLIFGRNGFRAPCEFELENYTLLIYRKQLIDDGNYEFSGDSAVFCTGTPVYRGLSYRPSLKMALSDYIKGTLSVEDFIGNFCLIFFHNKKISILLDKLTVQHVFVNDNLRRISSSFLALLSSFDHKLHLDRSAFFEKITTGLVTGPNTLIKEISQVDPLTMQKLGNEDIIFIPGNTSNIPLNFHRQGIDQSIDTQIETLKAYFSDISSLSAEYKTDIGLSGGYDSRLLYAFSKFLPGRISAYTHATAGVHEREVEIVKQFIKDRDIQLNVIPTIPAWHYFGSELEELLKDCMYFFDGRSGSSMSTFSPIYTRSYRVKAMGENRLNLNGSGGEIYRNFSHTGFYKINGFEWMKAHVYFPNIQNAIIQEGLMNEIHQFVTGKISARLGIDFSEKIDYLAILRYMAEISMPDSKGIFANAQNQLSFYLTPFIEKRIIRIAYQGVPYIGMTGTYEAKMIERIDRALASANSSYGFPLNAEPSIKKFFYWMKGHLPEKLNNFRHSMLRGVREKSHVNLDRYKEMVSNCEYMGKIDQLLNTHFPEVRWSELVRDGLALAMVTNIGTFLQEFEGKIDF